MASDTAEAVVRRNTEEVQSKGNFDVFEEVFADDFDRLRPRSLGDGARAGRRHAADSNASSRCFASMPPTYCPMVPSLRTTR